MASGGPNRELRLSLSLSSPAANACARLVIVFPSLLRNPEGMRRDIARFGRSSGNDQRVAIWPDLPWASLANL